MNGQVSWTAEGAWQELDSADLPPVLRVRSELLLLRMRIEQFAQALPPESLVDGVRGQIELRLWGLVSVVEPSDRAAARQYIQQVQRAYRQSSEYLHCRRSALIPSTTELAQWVASVDALAQAIQAA